MLVIPTCTAVQYLVQIIHVGGGFLGKYVKYNQNFYFLDSRFFLPCCKPSAHSKQLFYVFFLAIMFLVAEADFAIKMAKAFFCT